MFTANQNYCYLVTFDYTDPFTGVTYPTTPLAPGAPGYSNASCNHDGCSPPLLRPGFDQNILAANDDGSTDLISLPLMLNFFGTTYSHLYVNNNGNVTFQQALGRYTPRPLAKEAVAESVDIVAPFWADVDTRGAGSGLVTYGSNMVNNHAAFGVNWIDVGYYQKKDDKLNAFQLVLINRSDRADGDYDVEFNYAQIQWETGDASGGSDGLGGPSGNSARAGFASSSGWTFELDGSGTNSAFLDANLATGLIHTSYNSGGVLGRYVYPFHNGTCNLAHP